VADFHFILSSADVIVLQLPEEVDDIPHPTFVAKVNYIEPAVVVRGWIHYGQYGRGQSFVVVACRLSSAYQFSRRRWWRQVAECSTWFQRRIGAGQWWSVSTSQPDAPWRRSSPSPGGGVYAHARSHTAAASASERTPRQHDWLPSLRRPTDRVRCAERFTRRRLDDRRTGRILNRCEWRLWGKKGIVS